LCVNWKSAHDGSTTAVRANWADEATGSCRRWVVWSAVEAACASDILGAFVLSCAFVAVELDAAFGK
jgi:hypothetical protein